MEKNEALINQEDVEKAELFAIVITVLMLADLHFKPREDGVLESSILDKIAHFTELHEILLKLISSAPCSEIEEYMKIETLKRSKISLESYSKDFMIYARYCPDTTLIRCYARDNFINLMMLGSNKKKMQILPHYSKGRKGTKSRRYSESFSLL